MKYKIIVSSTREKVVEVEAETRMKALDKVDEDYHQGKIELDREQVEVCEYRGGRA